MTKKILIVFMTLALFAMSTSSFAAVTTRAVPGTYATLTAAIAAVAGPDEVISVAGDFVVLDAATYTLPAQLSLTIKCSSVDSTFTIRGVGAGDLVVIPAAASGASLTAPTVFQNVIFDGLAAKVAANRLLKVATAVNYVKLYNCTFSGKANTTLELVEFAGAATGWQIENCTFNNAISSSVALNFTGTGGTFVTAFNILGNTFNGLATGAIATDARAIFVSDIAGQFQNIYVGGNTFAKEGIVLNYNDVTPLPDYANVRVYDNIFTQCNAFNMQNTNADVLTIGHSSAAAPLAWGSGQLLIKGNKFGSLTTEGDTFFAIMFDGFTTEEFNEANVFINNNNFQYPMTNGADTNTWGGHVTANKTGVSTLSGIDATANYWGQITGPLTAYESKGIAVVKTTGAPYTYTGWISTYAVPQIDETNHGITIFDYDGNGHIDRAVVWFDQYVDPSTIAYSGWVISGGYTFKATKAVKLSIDNDHEGTPDGTYCLTLFITESSSYDTGVKPEITYTKASGTLTGITGNINAKVNDVLAATATEHDKALPIVVSSVTKDNGTGGAPSKANDGFLDGVVITFSEAVTLASRTAGTDADWENSFALGGLAAGYSLKADGGTGSGDTITLAIVQGGGADTGTKPTVTYTKNGSDDVSDTAVNLMLTTTAFASTDGAAPVAILVETQDFSSNNGIGDPDGFIDGFNITFSEDIAIAAVADSAKIRAALSAVKVSNTIDFSGAAFFVAGTKLSIKAKSMKDGSWDTDAKPALTYASQSGVKDAAGVPWVYFWDSATVAAATTITTAAVVDKAKPCIVLATGQVSSTNLWITFSEPVKSPGGASATLIEAADLTYNNVSNVGLNATTIAGFVDANGADKVIEATMDNNFTVADVVNDSIKVTAGGNITDLATAPNNSYIGAVPSPVYVTINDTVPPTLSSAVTLDLDNDGWIDTIKLTFSESLNDANLAGYNGTDKISLNAATNWAVAGYTVVGLNFIGVDGAANATEQTTATADAITRGLTGIYDDYATWAGNVFTKKVIDVNDKSNDSILYLMVAEGSGTDKTNGDTNAVPALTVNGISTAGKVGDFKPNYYATVTATPTTDKAGAALMGAEFKSANDLTVYLSEAVADTVTLAAGVPTIDELVSGDFTIYVGTWGNAVSAKAKDVTQSAPGVVELYFKDSITTADNGGWIGLSGAGVLNDNAAFASTQTIGMASGIKTLTAWDGTTPGGEPTGPLTAPSNLVIADVTNDNGHWVLATFKASTDTRVQSYQFYRAVVVDTLTTNYILTAWAPKMVVDASGYSMCYVPTPINGTYTWGVVASSGTVLSAVAKAGDITVASLATAAKAAADVELSPMATAEGGAIDNLAFSPLTAFAGNDAPGAGAGILISWTAPADNGVVGQYGIQSVYSFPIYGVDKYEVYRRAPGTNAWALAGTTGPGVTSYVDAIADGKLVYQYMVKAYDGNEAHTLSTATVYAMANMNANGADFSSDGKVDFTDFTMFASAYGKKSTDTGWVGLYDMAPNGKVDFDDFTAFSADYGFGVAKAAKAAEELPSSNIGIGLTSSVDEANSMYYVNVNFSDAATINGFELTLSYNPAALELVKESITGLVGLNIPAVSDGNVTISSMFAGENFNGTFTIGFKNRGINNRINVEVTNALVADNQFAVSQVKDLTSATLKAMPTVYTLSKNFPNPFNPTTTIEYAIPSSGKVELVVYNMTGQKVRTLVSEAKAAGFFKVVWNGRNDTGETVASGLYFYKLVSGKFNKIEKMTLVK